MSPRRRLRAPDPCRAARPSSPATQIEGTTIVGLPQTSTPGTLWPMGSRSRLHFRRPPPQCDRIRRDSEGVRGSSPVTRLKPTLRAPSKTRDVGLSRKEFLAGAAGGALGATSLYRLVDRLAT